MGKNKVSMSRRKFFKGVGGVGAATLLASASPTLVSGATKRDDTRGDDTKGWGPMTDAVKPIPPVQPPAKWDIDTDVIVIGTGCSGAAATVSALENGAKVITLEKMAIWGGHSQYSMILANTAVPPEKVMAPAMDNLYLTAHQANPRNTALDSLIAHKMFGKDGARIPSGPADNDSTVKWLYNMGVRFTDQFTWAPKGEPLAPIDPEFSPPENPTALEGYVADTMKAAYGSDPATTMNWFSWHPFNVRAFPRATQKRAMELGANVMYETKVIALVKSGNTIVGVKAEKADGSVLYIKAPSVVICTGGYMANRDMIKHYWEPRRVQDINRYCGLPSATGDGIRMGQGAGAVASVMDTEGELWDGGAHDPTMLNGPRSFYSAANQMSRQATLVVNKLGKRFFAESATLGTMFVYRAKQKNSQPDATCFTIFDSTMITPEAIITKFFPLLCEFPCPWFKDDFKRQLAAGIIQKADTIEEMAKLMDVDAATLKKTVEQYNGFCAATDWKKGVTGDTEFFKAYNTMYPIEEPPFYFVKGVGGSIISTYGGLDVDPETMLIVDADRKPISGLYGAGETLALRCGVADGTTTGRLAGELAAKKALGKS